MQMNPRHSMVCAVCVLAAAIAAPAMPLDKFRTMNECRTALVDPPVATSLLRPHALRYRKVPMPVCERNSTIDT